MRSTTGGGTLRWRQAFSGEERSLRGLRHWLASLLPASPARDDVISIANELGSNAIRHTASGRGLHLVHGLASRTGVIGNRQGRLVWAEIPWTNPGLAGTQQNGLSGASDAGSSESPQTCSSCPFDVDPAETQCHFSRTPRFDENCYT
jgi:hypothetical protein